MQKSEIVVDVTTLTELHVHFTFIFQFSSISVKQSQHKSVIFSSESYSCPVLSGYRLIMITGQCNTKLFAVYTDYGHNSDAVDTKHSQGLLAAPHDIWIKYLKAGCFDIAQQLQLLSERFSLK